MGGKQRTAKEKKSKKHRGQIRKNTQAEGSGTSNGYDRQPAESCLEVYELVKSDMKILLELKFKYLENAVKTGKIRPRNYNPEDINCSHSMRDEHILEMAVDMEKKTFTKMARELLDQNAEAPMDLFWKVQNVLEESAFLLEVQMDICKMDMMIDALRNAADKKENEWNMPSQSNVPKKMKKLKVK